jgi:hypothetical protein
MRKKAIKKESTVKIEIGKFMGFPLLLEVPKSKADDMDYANEFGKEIIAIPEKVVEIYKKNQMIREAVFGTIHEKKGLFKRLFNK